MFNIGDYVFNQKTGNLGKVIGYGHQIVDNAYMSTVKVLVDYAISSRKRGIVEEDLFAVWISWEEAQKVRSK
ncbi:hypothetical protein [Aliterella atlantica]|uniref:Uncharacterized protein n=1 Tax=Aliterella atlantica CENA595 TaxID=1618023 RepID=A0A0D8ZR37_9CYAN|nr:hypothetical protein [Aliterella atlantica]KJH70974.1 hypothetical protein UH38_15440 [Aliterella atlantica CENA595]